MTTEVAEAFWNWFADNADLIRESMRDDPEGVGGPLSARLRDYHAGLVWDMSGTISGDWMLCISADGNLDYFPAVIHLIELAPEIPGWVIRPFRQPGPPSEIRYGGATLAEDDIWFSASGLGDALSVTLWIRGLDAANEEALAGGAVILLDNLLGEYDSVTAVRELHRRPLPDEDTRSLGLRPFRELIDVVAALKPTA